MQEMRRKQEEQRQRELDERKRKEAEAKRERLEEAEKKRLAMQQAIKQRDEAARRNFMVKKTAPGAAPSESGPLVFNMQDVMKTKEQLAEDKKIALSIRIKPLKIDGLRGPELKKVVNELWDTIIQLESDKYDLEEEQKRQEYHLKELTERQKQINKNKALKMGLELEDLSGKYPPKVRLASKYERRIDRRTFNEKTELFNGGYVQVLKKMTDEDWAKKIDEFKESHGDKHVPKWDPSAPRKDAIEPGTKMYDDEDSDAESTDALVGKLRGYMEQQQQQQQDEEYQASRRGSSSLGQSRKGSVAQHDEGRRRSSQVSMASSRRQSAPKEPSPPPQEEEEEEEGEEEGEEEEYEDEDEEYEEEEEE